MEFKLNFNMDNDVFNGPLTRDAEIIYILDAVTEDIQWKNNGIIRDSNGNTIGSWDIS